MVVILELLFSILMELGLQLLFEALFEVLTRLLDRILGGRLAILGGSLRRPVSEVAFLAFCAVAGTVVGGLSFLLFPEPMIRNRIAKAAGLLIIPVAVGALFTAWGGMLDRRGGRSVRLDHFLPAFLFAFTLGLVRTICAW